MSPNDRTQQQQSTSSTPKSATESVKTGTVSPQQPSVIVQRAMREPHTLSPHDVMQLQRTIGNQAAMQLFSQARGSGQANFGSGSGVLQCASEEGIRRRRERSANFLLNEANRFQIGFLTEKATLRDHKLKGIGDFTTGCAVLYVGSVRDNFSTNDLFGTKAKKDHVYGMVVTDATGNPTAKNTWQHGWIAYEKLKPDYSRSADLQEKMGELQEEDDPTDKISEFVNDSGQALTLLDDQPRKARAPRAIRAWAEKNGVDLGASTMPLDDEAVHGFNIAENLADDDNDHYETIDPDGKLGLKRLDPNKELFQEYEQFLNANAAAMPGTMAKDHELRDTKTGGDRARLGQEWLASYEEDFNEAEYVAITGAQITNVFVNDNAPTWEAYNRNTEQLGQSQKMQNPQWHPAQDLRGKGNDAQVDKFTTPRAGEMYLFHGTSRNNVFNISMSGFDPEYVNYTFGKGYGKTGYGTAFTDQFAKALAYAPPEKVEDDNGAHYKHYVLVARVFSGNVYHADDRARRTRGNLELTEENINHEEAKGNMMKAQGDGSVWLGKNSDTVRAHLDQGNMLNSTVQDRNFNLRLEADDDHEQQDLSYRDVSLTIPAAIQMYPAFIIECEIPKEHVRKGTRRTGI